MGLDGPADDGTLSSGTYSLSGSSTVTADAELVGWDGNGIFNHSGGTNTVGFFALGYGSGSGTYSLSNGLVAATDLYVGSSGSGSFVQSGGVVSANDTQYIPFDLGQSKGALGTYQLSGSGMLSSAAVYVGDGGTGIFIQSGGTNSVSGPVVLGNTDNGDGTFGAGTYQLSGSGVLSSAAVYVGNGGSGLFIQTGGTNTVAGPVVLGVANNGDGTTGSGTYSLNGGLLQVQGDGSSTYGTYNGSGIGFGIAMGSGSSEFDAGGGTIQATGSWGLGVNSFNLTNSSSKLTVDSNGNAVILFGPINGPGGFTFVDSTGGGLVFLPNANTYTGGTTIQSGYVELGDPVLWEAAPLRSTAARLTWRG